MPSIEYSPYPGTLSALIRFRVYRNLNLQQTVKQIKELKPKIHVATIENLFDYWRGTRQSAKALRQSGANRIVGDVIKSSRKVKAKLARVGVIVPFENPDTEEIQQFGFDFDVNPNLTKQELLQTISKKFFEWLFAYYSVKDLSFFKSQEFLDSIQIVSIEGL